MAQAMYGPESTWKRYFWLMTIHNNPLSCHLLQHCVALRSRLPTKVSSAADSIGLPWGRPEVMQYLDFSSALMRNLPTRGNLAGHGTPIGI